jgi:6-phosphogluconolactonase
MIHGVGHRFLFASVVELASLLGSWAAPAPKGEYFVYFGTYTGFKYISRGGPAGKSRSKGIYVSRFRPATGEVSEPQLAAAITNPSFVAIHPNHRFLYALTEDPLSLGPFRDKGSSVSAFTIDPATGKLTFLNTVPTAGTSTCYLSLDKTGKNLLLANFGSGNISVRRVNDDGSLGDQSAFIQHTGSSVHPLYQTAPHAHSIDVSPDNRFVVVSDLGIDKVLVYRFDAAIGSLTPNDPPFAKVKPGFGPRHFAFHPNGRFGYLLNEMGGAVTAFAWDASRGILTQIQEIGTVPADYVPMEVVDENHSGEVVIDASGKFLYDSNRGPDTIAVLSIDAAKGTLALVEQAPTRGLMPRNFEIDPTGSYLFAANQASDDIVLFRIQDKTGRILPSRTVLKVDTPVCVRFMPVE